LRDPADGVPNQQAALDDPLPDLFSSLVTADDDTVGLLAFGMHERSRRAILANVGEKDRSQALRLFVLAEAIPARVADARAAAAQRIAAVHMVAPIGATAAAIKKPVVPSPPPPGAIRKAVIQLVVLAVAVVAVALMIRALFPVH